MFSMFPCLVPDKVRPQIRVSQSFQVFAQQILPALLACLEDSKEQTEFLAERHQSFPTCSGRFVIAGAPSAPEPILRSRHMETVRPSGMHVCFIKAVVWKQNVLLPSSGVQAEVETAAFV